MDLTRKWDVVNKLRSSKLDRWQYDSIQSNRSTCNITIQLSAWLPSLWERLSQVYLYNVPTTCAKALKSIFLSHGNITLTQIINTLITHGCQPKLTNGNKSYGFTKSKTELNDCIWYIYID